jgi:hypothetical protein
MEWLVMVLTGLGMLIILAPLLAILVTVFILVPLAHLAPQPPMVARASFRCPFSRREVNVAFLTTPESPRPADVVTCSLFADGRPACEKACLGLAESGWTPSPMEPRYALLADGVAFRG